MRRFDPAAVAAGAALALVALGLTVAAAEVVDRAAGLGPHSNWVFLFYAAAFAGLVAGGRLAARRGPAAALPHGILAALGAYAVVVAVDLVAGMVGGEGPDPVALAFNALMAAAAGTLGTLVAELGARPRAGTGPYPAP